MISHLSRNNAVLFWILFLFSVFDQISAHGRLIKPPSRSTAWRYGYPVPVNYNDHELFCGGFTYQWQRCGGRCGVCGDPCDGNRPNELPNGKYAAPLAITGNYRQGDVIKVQVQLTANHRGYFVFRICPAISRSVEVTQECLDSNVLPVLNTIGKDKYKYVVPDNFPRTYEVELMLPSKLSCNRCVFQWTYTAGNNWGRCENGTSAVGCGPQETFRACADVSIVGTVRESTLPTRRPITNATVELKTEINNELDTGSSTAKTIFDSSEIERESVVPSVQRPFWEDWITWSRAPDRQTTQWWPTSRKPWIRETEPTTPRTVRPTRSWPTRPLRTSPASFSTIRPAIYRPGPNLERSYTCVGVGAYRQLPGIGNWCTVNCATGYCPNTHCKCY